MMMHGCAILQSMQFYLTKIPRIASRDNSYLHFGICWTTLPSRSLPLACLERLTPSAPYVPHCLKKKAVCCDCAWLRRLRTHCGCIGRANGPLSPPTISQSMPVKSILPRSSSSGSQLRNLTDLVWMVRSASIRGLVELHSTVTPSQALRGTSRVAKYSAIRSARLVRS